MTSNKKKFSLLELVNTMKNLDTFSDYSESGAYTHANVIKDLFTNSIHNTILGMHRPKGEPKKKEP